MTAALVRESPGKYTWNVAYTPVIQGGTASEGLSEAVEEWVTSRAGETPTFEGKNGFDDRSQQEFTNGLLSSNLSLSSFLLKKGFMTEHRPIEFSALYTELSAINSTPDNEGTASLGSTGTAVPSTEKPDSSASTILSSYLTLGAMAAVGLAAGIGIYCATGERSNSSA